MTTKTLARQTASRLSLLAFIHRFVQRQAYKRDRRRLLQLDDHLLRDIGVSREEADIEGRRSTWAGPDHWMR